MELVGRRYDTAEVVRIRISGSAFTAIEPCDHSSAKAVTPWIAPGFVDLQINGYGGRDFIALGTSVDDVVAITLALDRHGVTGYLPTLTTQSTEVTEHALAIIDQTCRERPDIATRILGVHVEGPYISPHDGPRGAHPRPHCRAPNWEEFQRWQQAAGGRIRLITLSPEYDEAPRFIRSAVDSGVLVAIGHTSATSAQIQAAVEAGARMSTHLGNGAHPQIRRHPNYIWDQLADDRLTASIIADGHHLPPAVVKCFTRMKTPARLVLVSDITGLGGMPPGKYSTGLGEVEVLEDGKLVVAGQRDLLAGAALPLEFAIPNMMRFAHATLAEAIDMATIRPAKLIGAASGELRVGGLANLIAFDLPEANADGPLVIRQTWQRGALVFDANLR